MLIVQRVLSPSLNQNQRERWPETQTPSSFWGGVGTKPPEAGKGGPVSLFWLRTPACSLQSSLHVSLNQQFICIYWVILSLFPKPGTRKTGLHFLKGSKTMQNWDRSLEVGIMGLWEYWESQSGGAWCVARSVCQERAGLPGCRAGEQSLCCGSALPRKCQIWGGWAEMRWYKTKFMPKKT